MRSRPRSIVVAALLMSFQALAVLGLTIWTAVQIFGYGEAALNLSAQIALIVMYVLVAASYFLVSFFLWRGKAWARSAAVALELLVIILSFSFFMGGNPLAMVVGGVMLVTGAAVLMAAFSPGTQTYLSSPGR